MNIVIDYRASKDTIDALLKLDYNVIKTPKLNTVYDTIAGHADIMIHKINATEIICEPTVFDYFKFKLPEYQITKGNIILKEKYPDDIAYNVCSVSNKIFCNISNTEKEILKRYETMSYKIINIKQGYAKCSICVVSDNAIITSDNGIFKTAQENDVDVLLVDDSDIKLQNFNHGFIGGATGLLKNNKLAVNGNIEKHRDFNKIIDYCKKYDVEVISLNSGDIVDIGSLILI